LNLWQSTGLSPSTQYRVTVRAKQLRAPGQQAPAPPPGPPPHEEAPGAYTDFRTLAKGLPDPPQVRINSKILKNDVP
jgi:RIMS-binding protein 2